jgi:REP element-mobilizing transposase RayT
MKNKNRQSIRLKDYDYSQKGAYSVTICVQDRKRLFGEVINGKMALNDTGNIVKNEWLNTSKIRPNIKIGEFIVMPNHIHGIIMVVGKHDDGRGVLQYAPTPHQFHSSPQQFYSPSQTIGSIIRGFKSTVTKQINIIRKTPRAPVWQRNYYEHIIRDSHELNKIREYIINNPCNWKNDKEYVQNG